MIWTIGAIALLLAIVGFVMWRGYKAIPPEDRVSAAPAPPPLPVEEEDRGFEAWIIPPPEAPTLFELAADADVPDELRGLRAFERVEHGGGVPDISIDGSEALILNDEAATLFDVASGRAVKTWRQPLPPERDVGWSDNCHLNCDARRIFLDVRPGGDASDYVLVDLEKRTVSLLHSVQDGQDAFIHSVLSADGRYFAGGVTYGKEHGYFDLEKPVAGSFGDYLIDSLELFRGLTLSRDGRRLAIYPGEFEIDIFENTDAPGDDVGPYGPHLQWRAKIDIEEIPEGLAFDAAAGRLLIVDEKGGITIADIEADETRRIQPLPVLSDDAGYQIGDIVWVPGTERLLLQMFHPTAEIVLIDLVAGEIERIWTVSDDAIRSMAISPTGGFALVAVEDSALRVFPLLDETA